MVPAERLELPTLAFPWHSRHQKEVQHPSSGERGADGDFPKKRSGNWQAVVQRDGRYLSRTFDTKADAEEWAGEIERDIRRGQFLDRRVSEKTTLSEALDVFADTLLPGKKGEYRVRRRIEAWKRDPLAKRSLASIRGADVASWRNMRATEGAAANTIRRDLTILSHLFTVARKEWKGGEGLVIAVLIAAQTRTGKTRRRGLWRPAAHPTPPTSRRW
jgi:hypothetical protein